MGRHQRLVHVVIVVALIGATLAACRPAVPAKPAEPTAAKPASLTIAGVAGNEAAGLKAIIPLWEKQEGVKINFVEYPYNTLYEKIVTTMQSSAPTFDLLMVDDPWMPKLGSEAWFLPLDETFGYQKDPDIFPIAYDLGTWPPPRGPVPLGEKDKPAHLYAVTMLGNVEMFAYRSDLVSKPETWDDVVANAQKVHDPANQMYGYALRAASGDPIGTEFYPIMASYGGRVFDDNWNVVADSPECLQALKMVMQLAQYSPPGVANYDAAERSRELAAGRAAMAETWPAEASQFMENAEVSKVKGKVAYMAVPKGPSGKQVPLMGNWLLGISKFTSNKEWAYKFLQWATSAEVQKEYALAGGVPFRKSILTDPALNEKFPYFAGMADSYAAPPEWIPRTPEWFAVVTIWGAHLNAAVAGTEKPEDALKQAAAEIKTHMEEAGYYK